MNDSRNVSRTLLRGVLKPCTVIRSFGFFCFARVSTISSIVETLQFSGGGRTHSVSSILSGAVLSTKKAGVKVSPAGGATST
jgi:hypothetical protein